MEFPLQLSMRRPIQTRQTVFLVTFLILSALLVAAQSDAGNSAQALSLSGDIEGIHDPSIIKDGNTWYVFSTRTGDPSQGELPIHCS